MTYIFDCNFHQVLPESPIKQRPVEICNNMWIRGCVSILLGAVISENSVVASEPIVTGVISKNPLTAEIPEQMRLTVHKFWKKQ